MNGPVDYMAALLLIDPAAVAATVTVGDGEQRIRANAYRYECISRLDDKPMPSKSELELAWANYTPPLQWSRTELLALFTREETRLIRSVAMADSESASAIVLDEMERRPPEHIYRSDSATLIQLLTALVTEGELESHRPAQILAGIAPA